MNYHQQLKHPLWQKKRLEVLEYHDFTCQHCNSNEDQLHIHHPYYKKGALLWDYDKKELQCLCNKCHAEAHSLDEKIRFRLSELSTEEKNVILGVITSYLTPPDEITEFSDENFEYGYSLRISPSGV